MEITMMQNQRGHTEIEGYRLPPERWEFIREDAMVRARDARTQMLRDFAHWLAAHAAAVIRYPVDGFRAWRRRQSAVYELQSLDDRSLRDIGVGRSEIQSVVGGWDSTRLPRGELALTRGRELKKAPTAKVPSAPSRATRKNAA
jgi:uncharacterized protein YjiS (DUF1127 family)